MLICAISLILWALVLIVVGEDMPALATGLLGLGALAAHFCAARARRARA